MSCIIGQSAEETYNRLKNGNQIIDNATVVDVESFEKALDELNGLPIQTTYDVDGNRKYSLYNHTFTKSASDVVKDSYAKRSGTTQKSTRPLGVGTVMHGIMEDTISLYYDAYENGISFDDVDTSSFWKTNQYQYVDNATGKSLNVILGSNQNLNRGIKESFENLAKIILTEAIENQNKIDPGKKIKIRMEQRLVNPKYDMIGHQDLMIIFSNLTVWDLDFKTKSPYNFGKNKKNILAQRALGEKQIENYGSQMRNYKKAKEGFSNVRVTRSVIIPIIYSEYVKEGVTDEVTINSVYTGYENKASTPIATEISELEDKAINSVLKDLYKTLNKLKENKRSQKDPVVKESLQRRYDNLREVVQAISLLNINNETFKEIKILMNTGLSNINRLGSLKEKQLEELENQLSYITGIHDIFIKILNAEQSHSWINDNATLLGNVNLILDYYSKNDTKIKSLMTAVTSERLDRALDKINDDFKSGEVLKMSDLSGWVTKNLTIYDQVDNPVVQEISKLYLRQEKKAIDDYNKKANSIISVANAAFNYAKSNLGLSQTEVQNMMVNKKRGSLITVFKPEYYERISQAIEDKDVAWLQEHFEFKDQTEYEIRYNERYQNRRKSIIKEFGGNQSATQSADIFKDELDANGKVVWKAADKLKQLNNELSQYEIQNNMLKSKAAWLNKNNIIFNTKLKVQYADNFKSEEYKNLEKHQPILEYYKHLTELNAEIRELLGVDYQSLPPTFIANFKAELVEQVMSGFDKYNKDSDKKDLIGDWISDALSSNQIDAIEFSNNDTPWNEGSVPVMGMQDLKANIKSYDLLSSTLIFMKSAYLSTYLTESLPEAQSLLKLLDVTNKESKNFVEITNLEGPQSNVYELAQNMIAYKWLGKRYKDAATLNKHKLFGMELGKTMLSLRNYNILTKLGYNFVSSAGSALGGLGRAYLISVGNVAYSKETFKDVVKEFGDAEKRSKMRIIAEYFNVSAEGQVRRDVRKNIKGLNKHLRSDGLMYPWTFGDDKTSYLIATSIAKEWTFNEDGNLTRLDDYIKSNPKATSIYDMFELDLTNADQPFNIKNGDIKEESWVQFHKAVRATMLEVTGQLNDKELMGLQNTILGTMFSTYKGWFPAIVRAEFGDLQFSHEFNTIKEGRIRSAASNWFGKKNPNEKFYTDIVSKMGVFVKDFMVDSVMYFSDSRNVSSYIKEDYIKNEFETWSYDNPMLAKKLGKTYEEQLNNFKKSKQKNIAIALAEIRMVLLIGALIVFAKSLDLDDDDEPDYKQTWLMRQTFKTLTKFHMEFRTPIDIREWASIFDTKIPAMGMLVNTWKSISNGIDETRDTLVGENSKQDKSPWFHYFRKEVPLLNPFFKIFDNIYEYDIQNDPSLR